MVLYSLNSNHNINTCVLVVLIFCIFLLDFGTVLTLRNSWFDTVTSIKKKSGGIKLVLWVQTLKDRKYIRQKKKNKTKIKGNRKTKIKQKENDEPHYRV
jgi:hypothetical protein